MSVLFTSFSTCISHSQQEGMEGQTGISLDGSVMFSYLDPNGIIRGRILVGNAVGILKLITLAVDP